MPFPLAYAIPAGIAALGTLNQRKQQPPQAQQLPAFDPGVGISHGSSPYQTTQYQALSPYQSPDVQLQPMQGQLAQGLLGQLQQVNQGGSALPEQYRQAVLGQATRSIERQRDLDQARAVETANKYGLLGSGSLGVRLGLQDEQAARQYGNIEDQLMQAELGQRNQLINQLFGVQGQQLDLERVLQQMSQFGREDATRQNEVQNQFAATQNKQKQAFDANQASDEFERAFRIAQQRSGLASKQAVLNQNAGNTQYQAGQQQTGDLFQTLANTAGQALMPQYARAVMGMLQPRRQAPSAQLGTPAPGYQFELGYPFGG